MGFNLTTIKTETTAFPRQWLKLKITYLKWSKTDSNIIATCFQMQNLDIILYIFVFREGTGQETMVGEF